MTFTPLPRRARNSRVFDYRLGRDAREGLDGLTPLPDLPHLLGVTIVMHPRRRRHLRPAGVLLLVLVAGVLVLAYRRWRATARDVAPPVAVPVAPEGARTPPSPEPPLAAPLEDADDVASISPARYATPREPDRTQPRRPQGVVASAPVRPQWRLGRGPSTAVPPVPAARPTVPGRPHPHLPG